MAFSPAAGIRGGGNPVNPVIRTKEPGLRVPPRRAGLRRSRFTMPWSEKPE